MTFKGHNSVIMYTASVQVHHLKGSQQIILTAALSKEMASICKNLEHCSLLLLRKIIIKISHSRSAESTLKFLSHASVKTMKTSFQRRRRARVDSTFSRQPFLHLVVKAAAQDFSKSLEGNLKLAQYNSNTLMFHDLAMPWRDL